MPHPTDSRIWIIEDMVDETQKYYLGPLEQIARKGREGASFPQIHAIFLNLNDDLKEEVVAIGERIAEDYPTTQPRLYPPNPDHEKNYGTFFNYLRNLIQDQDIVLVDPTVCGSHWIAPPDQENFLYFVFNQIIAWKTHAHRGRVLLVSNFKRFHESSPDVRQWEDLQKITIPKFDSDMKEYTEVLEKHLEPFLTPRSDWTKHLNPAGIKNLVPFVEELRSSKDHRRIFYEVGESAKWAILHLLSPEPHCAKDIIEATDGDHYYDPASDDRVSRSPSHGRHKGTARLYDILIRRHILYGLRRAWEKCNPSKSKYTVDYKVWLEVVAAGYFWYSNEISAVKQIIHSLKTPTLTLNPDGTIDLRRANLEFMGKEGMITKAHVHERKLDIRYERGSLGYVRFLEGDISFLHPGETTKGKANYYFRIKFHGNRRAIPADGATKEIWDYFWRSGRPNDSSTDRADEFIYMRRGRVGKLQTELSHRCHFADYNYLLTFFDPMPEEEEWWEDNGEFICRRVTQQLKGLKKFNPFDSFDQSEAKISRQD